jgi:hypothetical protein
MSKKFRKHRQKKNFPWVILTFGGVLLLTAIFLFANRDGDEDGGIPSIAVDQQSIDYGDVKFGVTKTFAIKVTNTGDGRLQFKEDPYIEVVDGC